MGADPFSGAIYVFRAKRADRIKLVYFDGTGVCLLAKRLEDGKFVWPTITDGVVRLTAAQLFSAKGRVAGDLMTRSKSLETNARTSPSRTPPRSAETI